MSRLNTALVTGAGRGIGKETALLLSKRGFNVAICSRNWDEIDSAIKDIRLAGRGEIIGVECDVSISSDVSSMVKQTLEKFGRIDVLINNAGIVHMKKLIETSTEVWDQIVDTNLKGTFLFCKEVLPHMIENNDGVIINVSSGAGKVGFENLSAYCASKFGIIGLTESLAREVRSYYIRALVICPGEVSTSMQEAINPQNYELNKHRMIHPEKVAEKIVDMILNNKKYRNGINVDIR